MLNNRSGVGCPHGLGAPNGSHAIELTQQHTHLVWTRLSLSASKGPDIVYLNQGISG